ncbi:MAG TPA: DUF6531 domain-containing protein [Terriglobales bacterium]|nr:DUF6531 domain-containing protein [Terriglobales bacterium]
MLQFRDCATGGSKFRGSVPYGTWTYHCRWTTYPDGGTVHPSIVTYHCESGYIKAPGGKCIKLEEANRSERAECRSPGGSNANPTTPNPINLLTGTKVLSATDFKTADGRLVVSRSYRSQSVGKAEAAYREIVGLGTGWHFDFMPEIHIRTPFSSLKTATVHWPNGSAHDFKLDTTLTVMEPLSASGLPHSEFQLSFVGTWPSPLSTLEQRTSPTGTTTPPAATTA